MSSSPRTPSHGPARAASRTLRRKDGSEKAVRELPARDPEAGGSLLAPRSAQESSNVKAGVASLLGRVVWTRLESLSEAHVRTRHHRASIPIIFKIGESRRVGVPRCEELDEQTHGCRSQYAVGPNYLGTCPGRPVALGFLLETLVSDESAAAHAGMAGHRKNHLQQFQQLLRGVFASRNEFLVIVDENAYESGLTAKMLRTRLGQIDPRPAQELYEPDLHRGAQRGGPVRVSRGFAASRR
jgi:hypothetical protein